MPGGQVSAELVSNSLKHAFPDTAREGGRVAIRLSVVDGGRIELIVSNNGRGLSNNLEARTPQSLGVRLVTIVAEDQLGGAVEWTSNGGTCVRITFLGE